VKFKGWSGRCWEKKNLDMLGIEPGYSCPYTAATPTEQSRLPVLVMYKVFNNNNNSVALVREPTIPNEQPPLVGEVSANF
jgi:hypothetical protein